MPDGGVSGPTYSRIALGTTNRVQPSARADLDNELGGSDTLGPLESKGDTREWRLFLAACLCSWSLICIGIAIDDSIPTVSLVVLAAGITFVAVRPIKKIAERKQRILAEQSKQHALTGKAPKPVPPTLKFLMSMVALTIFGIIGFWLACVYFYDGHFFDADGDASPPAFAVQLWFGLFALLGGLFAITICLIWFIEWVMNLSGLGPSPDFDPTKGPEIPPIRYPAYHMVVDCLVPLYIPFAIGLLACIAGFYSPWYAVAALFVCFIAFIPAWTIRARLSRECERLQLYFDWHDNFAPREPIDESIVALKEERETVKTKYEGASAWIYVMLGLILVPLLLTWPTTGIEDIRWGWLYFGIVFFLGNSLTLMWGQEIMELVRSRTQTMDGMTT